MKTTLVFGASLRPERYAHMAMIRLQQNGHEVKAYGMREGEVNGINIDTELKVYHNIDTVTLYLNPKRQAPFYDYIISLQPKRVIFNPGTENTEFYNLLEDKGIQVEVACTLVLLGTNQY